MCSETASPLPEENPAQPVRETEHGAMTAIPQGYSDLLQDVKRRVAQARVRATVSVNRELVMLYWDIGWLIIQRQEEEGWGASVIERLSRDLQAALPDARGFSMSNIWRKRAFCLAYPPSREHLAQPVRESSARVLPEPVAEIPWGHNVVLVEKVKEPQSRLWYAAQTIEHGWSRAVLVHQIESNLYERQGRVLTNFERALPAPAQMFVRRSRSPHVCVACLYGNV